MKRALEGEGLAKHGPHCSGQEQVEEGMRV